MKLKWIVLIIVITFLITGCVSTEQMSSGFRTSQNTPSLPPGIPNNVGVMIFLGDYPYNIQATDMFASNLIQIGFNVVERQRLNSLLTELKYQQSSYISPETRIAIGQQLGIEGIFLGSVATEANPFTIMSYINVRLIDVQTGKVLWSCNTQDPRITSLDTSLATSVSVTTKEAIKLLLRDIESLR